MNKKALILVCILLMSIVFPPSVSLATTSDHTNTANVEADASYYLIHYNGEHNEIIFNDNVTLKLLGWTDENETVIKGKFAHQTDNITLNVTNELGELTINEDEKIQFRVMNADSFKIEAIDPLELEDYIEVIVENDNGTSIEENRTIDEFGTITKKVLTYYMKDNDKKTVITKEEYNSLNPSTNSLEDDKSEDTTKNTDNLQEIDNMFNTQEVNGSPSIKYSSHVQGIGWQTTVYNGEMAGTLGQAKRLEAIQISLENAPYPGGISYKTHVQSYGWKDSISDGNVSGTTGENKRLEAIQINLTGEMADHYDVYYRVHAEHFGWLDWAKNGASAGTEGLSKRLEAIEVILTVKGEKFSSSTDNAFLTKPDLVYSTHVQSYGWMADVTDGEMSGTEGQAKRLEAIKINLQDNPYSGDITYSTHIQSFGWLNNVSNGEVSGTFGQGKRMEAIKINVNGDLAKYYDIYYRVHSQSYGWLGWAKNGEPSGTEGLNKRLESIEVVLVEKGGNAPGSTEKSFIKEPSVIYTTHVQSYGWLDFVNNGKMSGTSGEAKRLESIKISLQDAPYSGNIVYSTHVQGYGWLKNVSNGEISGTSGQNKRMEAIKINLTGEIANHYDIYYRVHTQSFGWLGWAKNGMNAGSERLGKRLEAIEIKLVPKGQGEAVHVKKAFKQPVSIFLDPGHGGSDPGAIAGGYKESDLNLTIAKKVQALLTQRGYLVYMSRYNDTYVSLLERSEMANKLEADLFISIHHNSTGSVSTNVEGIESFYYEYNPAYPSKINGTMHNNLERVLKSVTLTKSINDNMVSYTGAYNRGTDGKAFSVVREAAMPATLLELGFMNNSKERQKLVTDSYQVKLAKAIADGIDEYYSIY